jgi:hypothetical protein
MVFLALGSTVGAAEISRVIVRRAVITFILMVVAWGE